MSRSNSVLGLTTAVFLAGRFDDVLFFLVAIWTFLSYPALTAVFPIRRAGIGMLTASFPGHILPQEGCHGKR
jgi:hypothetical protein